MWNVRDWFREFDQPPTGDDLAAWQDWFVAHGIDIDDVSYGNDNPAWSCWIERRASPGGQYQIVYTADDVDSQGRPINAQRVVDLVEPPAPFPVP